MDWLGAPSIYGVVVVYERYERLNKAIDSLLTQSVPVDGVVVVDNTPADRRAEADDRGGKVSWVHSDRNLGGAGGYALGVLSALARGADLIVMIDDDGVLGSDRFVEQALDELRRNRWDVLCPVAVNEMDPSALCFPYRVGLRRTYAVRDIERVDHIEGFGHLFNGSVIPASTFRSYGLPDLRLYIRGDEVDFFHRVRRAGGRIATKISMRVLHPSAANEAYAVLGDVLMAVDPVSLSKREMTFRNRGYIFWRHGMYLTLAADTLRYAMYFLVKRRLDWRGYVEWLRLTFRGVHERLGPPS